MRSTTSLLRADLGPYLCKWNYLSVRAGNAAGLYLSAVCPKNVQMVLQSSQCGFSLAEGVLCN